MKRRAMAVEPTSKNAEGPSSSPRFGAAAGHRSSAYIEHAELLNSTHSLVLWLVIRHCVVARADSAWYNNF